MDARQAIADARSLAQAASADTSHPPNGAISALAAAVQALCDAVESLERDGGPRLPLDPKLWEMRVRTDTHDGAVDPPDDRGGWHLVAPTGVASCGYHFSFFLWARKREES